MTLRLAALLLATLAVVIWRPPATLLDAALAAASDGRLRLLGAAGTLWSGTGTFASVTPDGHGAQPWLSARWRSDFGSLWRGRLGWRLIEGRRTVLRLELGPGGGEVLEANFDAPLKPLLDSIPHPLARAGWRGSARLESPGWQCTWQRSCRGTLTLTWIDAGVELVPNRRFGDYRLSASARGDEGSLQLTTLAGEMRVDGDGGWSQDGHVHFKGQVHGPPELVGRLPNVLDGIAFPTGDPQTADIELR